MWLERGDGLSATLIRPCRDLKTQRRCPTPQLSDLMLYTTRGLSTNPPLVLCANCDDHGKYSMIFWILLCDLAPAVTRMSESLWPTPFPDHIWHSLSVT